jgi:hypothetical protein
MIFGYARTWSGSGRGSPERRPRADTRAAHRQWRGGDEIRAMVAAGVKPAHVVKSPLPGVVLHPQFQPSECCPLT